MPEERWLPIPGFDGYEISSLGRVLSHKRGAPRVLKAQPDPAGYPTVQLHRDGRAQRVRVHRLVAEAFCEGQAPGTEVRHLNGIKSDVRAENLTWGTHSENALDMVRHGMHPWARRTECPKGHPYNSDNTYRRPNRPNHRDCRTCYRERKQSRALAAANVPHRACRMSAAGPFARQEFRMSTDTCHALPVCRPELPTVELFIPLKPPLNRHKATYTRRSPWTRLKRFVRAEGVAIGLCAPAPFALAYAIVQLAGVR